MQEVFFVTDLRSGSREPFGPRQPGLRGGLLRLSQWLLTILTVICIWPGVMLAFTAVTEYFPLLRGGPAPTGSDMLRQGAWLAWAALLVLTGLRVSGQWYRWPAFYPVAAAYGVLAWLTFPDASDPVGRCIVQLMAAVAAALCLLHAVWSLCERKKYENP